MNKALQKACQQKIAILILEVNLSVWRVKMIFTKAKVFNNTVYGIRETDQHDICVYAFKRIDKETKEPIIYVRGLEKIDESRRDSFVDAIKFEMGDAKIEKAKAEFLASNNETWFNIIHKTSRRGNDDQLRDGKFVAVTDKGEKLASLTYGISSALITGKPEAHISLSSSYAPNGVYDQLMCSFVDEMRKEFCVSKSSTGFGIYITTWEENIPATDLVKKLSGTSGESKNANKYGLKSCSYLGHNEEMGDSSETTYYMETLPLSKENDHEANGIEVVKEVFAMGE